MENATTNTKKFILNYGAILGVLSVLLGVILYVTDSHKEQSWIQSLIGFLIILGVIIFGIKAFKTANNGFLTLSQALKIGLGISLVGALIGIIWLFLLTMVIEPDFTAQLADMQREKLIEQYPDFTQEQIDQSVEMAQKFSTPYMMAAFSLIGNLFLGFIISLFGGLIMQKKQDLY
ncbi:DUF4199 domain-containing protein [Aquimarina hainanensis]|uniref:DUF4199 domain-containing protein n=1 Tax=Aquimarina hainanensis TaxID=1578017 RepID=A0ABW5N8S4_9FLAO|nr:DUF4199 domain-containing protein [Aquimarina sp. TRL1]QKX06258.1 DUF4199 domain-containing protein [Aquimarina sp. TRL1]